MVCAQVIGNDAAIALGGLYGNFELNVMLPLIARNLLEQIALLANGASQLAASSSTACGQQRANRGAARGLLALARRSRPHIGYDLAARSPRSPTARPERPRHRRERQVLPATTGARARPAPADGAGPVRITR